MLASCGQYGRRMGARWHQRGTKFSGFGRPQPARGTVCRSEPANNWREVKTWAGYAYFGSEAQQSGITIVNLNHLPDSIQWKVWRGDGFFDSLVVKSHAVQAEAGYLYICGGSTITNGVVIADLSDPWNPHIVSKYAANYVHDAFIRGDTTLDERDI